MRFAYIDSQGKEVGIPTVEALQLRIELGAITEETIFYDASKDRWDPAGEHEIFRTLSREIRERDEDGPRPPAPKVMGRTSGDRDSLDDTDDESHGGLRTSNLFELEQDPLADSAEPGEVGWVEADLADLTESDATAATGHPPDSGGDWDVDLGDFGSLELAPDLADDAGSGRAPVAPEDGGAAEDTERETEEGPGDGPEDGRADAEPDVGPITGDLELERPFAEQYAADSSVAPAEDLELDAPLAEAEPTRPGPWDERETAGEPDRSSELEVDASSSTQEGAGATGGGEGDEGAASPPRDAPVRPPIRTDPYDRRVRPPRTGGPRRPPRRPARSRGGPSPAVMAGGAVVVVAVGVAGWLAWSGLNGGGGEDQVEAGATAVVVPDLPSGLEPMVRPLAAEAYGSMLDSLRGLAASFALPPEPNPDWLAGVYLANADQYPDVAAYWNGFAGYLSRVRSVDEKIFLDLFRTTMAGSTIPAEQRDTAEAWVAARFQATAADRAAVYDQLEELIDAASDLHDFLVANGDNITYEPAAGLSRDPVTEAIPSTQALGDEMWERVKRITTALDALGTLDRVNTERVLDVFLQRLQSTGVA